jgi:nicotinamide riboside kinase
VAGKIAIIGTHGVGKTILTLTIASELRKLNVDADVVCEISRRSPFPINEATTRYGQIWILAAQMQQELECSLRSRVVVSDRSLLDNYAYMVRAVGRQLYLHPLLREWLPTYDALFYVPMVEEQVVPDSQRAPSAAFRREIDKTILDLLAEFEVDKRVVRLPAERDRHVPAILQTLRERRIIPIEEPKLF